MKRILLVLSALAVGAMFLPARSAPAQDDWDIEFRARKRPAPVAAVPVPVRAYAPEPPPIILPVYAGTGCRGQATYGGGCISRQAAPVAYAVPVQAGGCAGRMAGGYAAPVVYAGPRPFAYGVDGAPLRYGAPRGDGKFATASGRPAPPGVLPWNDPILGAWRTAAGYDRHYRP